MNHKFNTIEGNKPILFSAPHAHPHKRPNYTKEPKPRELYTREFVISAAQSLNANAIYTTAPQELDPNWYPQSPYRQYVLRFIEENHIELFFDVHGMSIENPVDIELSINKKDTKAQEITNTLASKLRAEFSEIRITYFIDDKQITLSEDVYKKLNTPTIQIEINLRVRQKSTRKQELIFALAA